MRLLYLTGSLIGFLLFISCGQEKVKHEKLNMWGIKIQNPKSEMQIEGIDEKSRLYSRVFAFQDCIGEKDGTKDLRENLKLLIYDLKKTRVMTGFELFQVEKHLSKLLGNRGYFRELKNIYVESKAPKELKLYWLEEILIWMQFLVNVEARNDTEIVDLLIWWDEELSRIDFDVCPWQEEKLSLEILELGIVVGAEDFVENKLQSIEGANGKEYAQKSIMLNWKRNGKIKSYFKTHPVSEKDKLYDEMVLGVKNIIATPGDRKKKIVELEKIEEVLDGVDGRWGSWFKKTIEEFGDEGLQVDCFRLHMKNKLKWQEREPFGPAFGRMFNMSEGELEEVMCKCVTGRYDEAVEKIRNIEDPVAKAYQFYLCEKINYGDEREEIICEKEELKKIWLKVSTTKNCEMIGAQGGRAQGGRS